MRFSSVFRISYSSRQRRILLSKLQILAYRITSGLVQPLLCPCHSTSVLLQVIRVFYLCLCSVSTAIFIISAFRQSLIMWELNSFFWFSHRKKIPWCCWECLLRCSGGPKAKIGPRIWCLEHWCHHIYLALWKASILGQNWSWNFQRGIFCCFDCDNFINYSFTYFELTP